MGGSMTGDRTDGERLATIETEIKSLGRSMGEVKSGIDRIANNCPQAQAKIASLETENAALKERLAGAEDRIKTLEARVWQIGVGVLGASTGIALIIKVAF